MIVDCDGYLDNNVNRNGGTMRRTSILIIVLFTGLMISLTCESATQSQNSDLDLKEANVTAVTFENTGGNSYTFNVTLIHDDDGEDGYANWWQVETLEGKNLGRRELLHAHGTTEFTRSEQISIPSDVTHAVVRGHDQTHGYGGQAIVIELESGEQRKVSQGSEAADFSDYLNPQPS